MYFNVDTFYALADELSEGAASFLRYRKDYALQIYI